jgi:hypothetical protein
VQVVVQKAEPGDHAQACEHCFEHVNNTKHRLPHHFDAEITQSVAARLLAVILIEL